MCARRTIAAVSSVPKRLLCVGDLNADITVTAHADVVPGSDTPGTVTLSGGGSAANVAAWAGESGCATRFAGVVGDDPLGDYLVAELAGHAVDVVAVRRAGVTSRAIAALVGGDGNRSMVSDLDTATVMLPDDVATSWFDDVSWLHLTAYSYFPATGRATFRVLADMATERSIPWSIDPSSSHMLASECELDEVRHAFTGAAVMVPNHDEAALLSGQDDPVAASERLLDLAETVAVTCGAAGVVVARRGSATFSMDPVPVDLVNALGCGDAFAAGFVTSRLGGSDDRSSAERAVALAARVAAMPSAR